MLLGQYMIHCFDMDWRHDGPFIDWCGTLHHAIGKDQYHALAQRAYEAMLFQEALRIDDGRLDPAVLVSIAQRRVAPCEG